MNVLTIAGEVLELDLLRKWSPQTCDLIEKLGSFDLTLRQSSWCGPTLVGEVQEGPLLQIRNLEQPVISIYPGTICLRPVEGRNATYDPMVWAKSPVAYDQTAQVALAYGYGEFRNETGPTYVTPVAMIRGFTKALAAKLRFAATRGDLVANFGTGVASHG